MKIGRRLAIKMLNVGKFALGLGVGAADVGRDRSPSRSTGRCSAALADRRRARRPRRSRRTTTRARSRSTEAFFWSFCDDYVELVKDRAYGAGAGAPTSAQAALALRAVGAAAAVRAGPAVRDRGGLVVVAGRLGAPRAVAVGRRAAVADGDPAVVGAVAEALAGSPQGEVGRARCRCAPRSRPPSSARRSVALVEAGRGDLVDAGRIATLADRARRRRGDRGRRPRGAAHRRLTARSKCADARILTLENWASAHFVEAEEAPPGAMTHRGCPLGRCPAGRSYVGSRTGASPTDRRQQRIPADDPPHAAGRLVRRRRRPSRRRA